MYVHDFAVRNGQLVTKARYRISSVMMSRLVLNLRHPSLRRRSFTSTPDMTHPNFTFLQQHRTSEFEGHIQWCRIWDVDPDIALRYCWRVFTRYNVLWFDCPIASGRNSGGNAAITCNFIACSLINAQKYSSKRKCIGGRGGRNCEGQDLQFFAHFSATASELHVNTIVTL